MKLSQLQYLTALHEHGSFSRAAQARFVSQPSLSVAIRELEGELGTRLVERGPRGVTFTAEGLAVVERAAQALREVEEIYRICEQARLAGKLTLASTPHYCASILLDVKLLMEQRYPAATLSVEESDSATVLRDVREGRVDMGIVQLCDLDGAELEGAVKAGEIRFEELFIEPMCVSVSEGHPLRGRERVAVSDLLQYPYGSYRNALNGWIAGLRQSGEYQCRVFRVNDISPLRILLAREQAFTIVPLRSVHCGNAMFQARMYPISVEGVTLSSRVGLISGRRAGTRFVRSVFSAVRERAAEYQRIDPPTGADGGTGDK